MTVEKSLEIAGFSGEAVPNVFYQQAGQTDALAVIFPGFGYHADLPMLYYPSLIARQHHLDVLRLNTGYNLRPEFTRLGDAEQLAWLDADAAAALDAALAQRSYRRLLLIGKSLGTQAMGGLLERFERLPSSSWLWLTPLLNDARLVEEVRRHRPRSLFVIGTADSYYDPARLDELVQATHGGQVVIQQANHGLEIPGQAQLSLQALVQVMSAVEEFIAGV